MDIFELQISFSTVGHMLDLILAQKSCIISSADKKTVKKQKLVGHQEPGYSPNDICGRDNPVNILSSLLDVLLLKKDITNRWLVTAEFEHYIVGTATTSG